VPTHGDFPWEQDERKRRQDAGRGRRPYAGGDAWEPGEPQATATYGRPRRRPLSFLRNVTGPLLFVAVLAAAGFAVQVRADRAPELPVAAAPAVAPQPPVAGLLRKRPVPASRTPARVRPYRLARVHSRWRSRSVVEIWGRTTAPDGTTIRFTASYGGVEHPLAVAPAAGRRFYVRERVPAFLRGQRIGISAQIER
jgi:hypothetical protein